MGTRAQPRRLSHFQFSRVRRFAGSVLTSVISNTHSVAATYRMMWRDSQPLHHLNAGLPQLERSLAQQNRQIQNALSSLCTRP